MPIAALFDQLFIPGRDEELTLGWGRSIENGVDLITLSRDWVAFHDHIMEGSVAFEIMLERIDDESTIFRFRSNDEFRGMYVSASIRAILEEAGFTLDKNTN